MYGEEGPVQSRGLLRHHADLDVDTMGAQVLQSASADARVWILDRDHRTSDARFDDAGGARPRTAGVGARLERAVERGAPRPIARVGQRVDLGVRSTGSLVRPAADDHPFGIHHERADHRVRAGAAAPSLGQQQRARHMGGVVDHHFSSKRASTYSCGANGIKSSMPSPTPTYRIGSFRS